MYAIHNTNSAHRTDITRAMRKTLDAAHVFHSAWGRSDSACRVRVYEAWPAGAGFPPVVIVSQLPGCAASVTNFAEQIATGIAADIASGVSRTRRTRLLPGTGGVVWVEHYPPGTLLPEESDLFRFVTFRRAAGDRPVSPEWGPWLCRRRVETLLLGCPIGA